MCNRIFCLLTLLLFGGIGYGQVLDADSEFIDHFDDNQYQWPEFEEGNKKAWFEEESYHLRGKSVALPVFAAIPIPAIQGDSFILETVITQLEGKKNMGYGLCWGAKSDRRDCYVFLVSSNRKFTVLRMERGSYSLLQPWTKTDIILGPKNENTLTVIRKENIFYCLINGQRVYMGPADPVKGTLSGIILHGTQEIKIDEFTLTFAEE